MSGNFVTEIDVGGFLEELDFPFRRDLINHRLEVVVPKRRIIDAHEFAIDAEHRRIVGGEVKVRGFLLGHEFEECVDASHGESLLES